MSREAALFDLVDSIYASALEPDIWSSTLARLRELFDLAGSTLLFTELDGREPPVFAFEGIEEDAVALYNEHFFDQDPTIKAALDLPAGAFVSSADLYPDEVWQRTAFFSELLDPWELGYVEGSTLLLGGEVCSSLGLHRPFRSGPLDRDARQLYCRLVPHLQRALTVHRRLADAERRAGGLEDATDRLRAGLILLDVKGRVLRANREARRIFAEGDSLRVERRRLVGARPTITSLLDAGLATTLDDALDGSGATLSVPRPAGRRGLELLFSRLPRSAAHGAAAALFVTDPERTPASPTHRLRELYGLSAAEAEVAALLVEGLDPREIADQRQVGITTVRSQLQSILQKVGVRRQAELVTTLLRGPLGLVAGEPSED